MESAGTSDLSSLKRGMDARSDDAKRHKNSDGSEPSKVLFCRNLPIDAMESEVMALCYPFGTVVRIFLLKSKGQAFVQFTDIQTAANVVNYYKSSPAQLRGRTIYIDFSNRQEIELKENTRNNVSLSSDAQGDPSSVIVVTVTNVVYPVTVEVLYQVFSKYGGVLKIICFVKNDQQKALVKMDSVAAASAAKASLDGQNIYTGCNQLHIVFSRLSELKVKYNNDKSRDFTNPTLPSDGPGAPAMGGVLPADPFGRGTGMFMHGPGMPNANPTPIGNPVVIASGFPEDKMHPDILFRFFGLYGDVVRVKRLYNRPDTALIQFTNGAQAQNAITYLNGINLFNSHIRVDRSRHSSVSMPRDGEEKGEEMTKDFSHSRMHRFKRGDSRHYRNITSPNAVLHISGIADDSTATEEDMIRLFSKFGSVARFKFFDNNRRMALVEMATLDDAVEALLALDNYVMDGKHIRVNFSKSTISRPKMSEEEQRHYREEARRLGDEQFGFGRGEAMVNGH